MTAAPSSPEWEMQQIDATREWLRALFSALFKRAAEVAQPRAFWDWPFSSGPRPPDVSARRGPCLSGSTFRQAR